MKRSDLWRGRGGALLATSLLAAACEAPPAEQVEASAVGGSSSYWEESWSAGAVDVGDTCQSTPECCAAGQTCPSELGCTGDSHRWMTNATAAAYCTGAHEAECLAPVPGAQLLRAHGEDHWTAGSWEGLPLYSQQTFPPDRYTSVEVILRARCGPTPNAACHAGVALYDSETVYRQLALVGAQQQMVVRTFAGSECQSQDLLAVSPDSWHKLRLDYFGDRDKTWAYYVDDVLRRVETPPVRGGLLDAPARVTLIFVGGQLGEHVDAVLQPIRVWSGGTPTVGQPVQADGFQIDHGSRYAQEIFAPGKDVARARLFFGAAGQRVIVSAYTDQGGKPGTLINESTFTAFRHGEQDVPLWIPDTYAAIWIVVRAQAGALADLGTSAPSTDPYPGRFQVSHDAGQTWAPIDRDLTFQLFGR
jgi:hypothetical protein